MPAIASVVCEGVSGVGVMNPRTKERQAAMKETRVACT